MRDSLFPGEKDIPEVQADFVFLSFSSPFKSASLSGKMPAKQTEGFFSLYVFYHTRRFSGVLSPFAKGFLLRTYTYIIVTPLSVVLQRLICRNKQGFLC